MKSITAPSSRRSHAARVLPRYVLLLVLSSSLLLIPIVALPKLAKLEFLPDIFVHEYAKLIGSTLVSVVVAWGWKHYDSFRHRKHAVREGQHASQRLQRVRPSLERIVSLEAPTGGVTERGRFHDDLAREIKKVHVVLEDVHIGLRALALDTREYLEPLCLEVGLLVDALRLLRDGPSEGPARSLLHIKERVEALHSVLSQENSSWFIRA